MRCLKPYQAPDQAHPLNCGSCINCRIRRASDSAACAVHEARLHEHNCSLTLTYDDQHLPAGGALNHRDWQLFAKKVRQAFGPFRFIMCGEYGDLHQRPHYHALIFGHDFTRGAESHRNSRSGIPMYRPAELQKHWQHGFCDVQGFTPEMARYVCGYITKKLNTPDQGKTYGRPNPDGSWEIEPYWRNWDTNIQAPPYAYSASAIKRCFKPKYTRPAPYIQSSRRPGIGWHHFWIHRNEYFARDICVVDGKERPIPGRYLRRCIDLEDKLRAPIESLEQAHHRARMWHKLESEHQDPRDIFDAAARSREIKLARQETASNSKDPDDKLSYHDKLQRSDNRKAYAQARLAAHTREPDH